MKDIHQCDHVCHRVIINFNSILFALFLVDLDDGVFLIFSFHGDVQVLDVDLIAEGLHNEKFPKNIVITLFLTLSISFFQIFDFGKNKPGFSVVVNRDSLINPNFQKFHVIGEGSIGLQLILGESDGQFKEDSKFIIFHSPIQRGKEHRNCRIELVLVGTFCQKYLKFFNIENLNQDFQPG